MLRDNLTNAFEQQSEGLILVTTEKDLMRLQGEPDAARLLDVLRVLPVSLAVDESEAFTQLVLSATGPV